MRISERKTTAAVLRWIIGEKLDDEFLAHAGCRIDLWRKLENGSRKITPTTASQCEASFGIAAEWLLAGDEKTLPKNIDGGVFDSRWFEEFQARKIRGEVGNFIAINPAGWLPQIAGSAAAAADKNQLAAFAAEMDNFAARLIRRFGFFRNTFDSALDHMQKYAPAFVIDICENDGEEERRERQSVMLEALQSRCAPRVIRTRRSVESEYWVEPPPGPQKPTPRPRRKAGEKSSRRSAP
jgi:hypothetical protein